MLFVKPVSIFFCLSFCCFFTEGSVFLLNDTCSGVVKFSVANSYLYEDFEINLVDVFKEIGIDKIACKKAKYAKDELRVYTSAGVVIFREEVSVYGSFTIISMVWCLKGFCLVLESWSYRNKKKLPAKIRRFLQDVISNIRILNEQEISRNSLFETRCFGDSHVNPYYKERAVGYDLTPVVRRLSRSNEIGKFEIIIPYYDFLIDKRRVDRQRAFFDLICCFEEYVKSKKKSERKELMNYQDSKCMWYFSYSYLIRKYIGGIYRADGEAIPVTIERTLHALFDFIINCNIPVEYVCRVLDGIIYYSSDKAKELIYQLFDRWWLEHIGR